MHGGGHALHFPRLLSDNHPGDWVAMRLKIPRQGRTGTNSRKRHAEFRGLGFVVVLDDERLQVLNVGVAMGRERERGASHPGSGSWGNNLRGD